MKRNQAFPSKFLNKDDVESPKTWTIRGVFKEVLEGENGVEEKPVLDFEEEEAKPFILNQTNWIVLEDLYGEDSDSWIGKRIELYKDASVMFGSKRVGRIRCRKPTEAIPKKDFRRAPSIETPF